MIDFLNITVGIAACPPLLDRLRRRDASLWHSDPEVQRAIGRRLGWLDAKAFMDQHAAAIADFAAQIRSEGYQQAVLLGMGGASLAPEVYAALFANASGALPLVVLDTTSPGHIRQVTAECETATTLFIVSSKTGTTVETLALEAHFFAWASARLERPQDRFVAISDPDSPLASLAAQRGYRKTFSNPADIGGRFSALSYFGLVPAALAGADLAALRAELPDIATDSKWLMDSCLLGMSLGHLGARGRNKLTLEFSPSLAPVAPWVEQLIDESTGKHGKGIVVIADEPRFDVAAYSGDRVFVCVDLDGETGDEARVQALVSHGQPVARWRVGRAAQLGAEFYRWEIATALAGHALGVPPFDEPDVDDSKAKSRSMLARPERPPRLAPQAPATVAALRALLAGARAGDYIAILAYLSPTPDNRARLARWRERLSRSSGLPCTIGFGPRYLHSSGQLHKGGPDQGLFVVLTQQAETELPIPGQPHGFGTLINAQAAGDLAVLKERGRRLVHLDLTGPDAALDELIESFP